MRTWRYILLPFSVIYGLVVSLRNLCYDIGFLCKSKKYELPVILVGNLTVGGTGKTPHVEKLVHLLQSEKYKTATLSRGYGRKLKGLVEVTTDHTATEVGDEPKQIRQKFKNITVVVDGNRRRGIEYILKEHPEVQAIVMDDGFQHRSVKASLSVLLKDYNELEDVNFLLPAGTLRELSSSAKRADAIIVSKTPDFFSPMEKRLLKERIQLYASQEVFFTYMKHGSMYSVLDDGKPSMFDKDYYVERGYKVLCVTGIANPEPFKEYLAKYFGTIEHVGFSDHHQYTVSDIEKIKSVFEKMEGEHKLILTTEKDAMRFMQPEIRQLCENIPMFYISIEVGFHQDDYEKFKSFILGHVKPNTRISSLFKAKN